MWVKWVQLHKQFFLNGCFSPTTLLSSMLISRICTHRFLDFYFLDTQLWISWYCWYYFLLKSTLTHISLDPILNCLKSRLSNFWTWTLRFFNLCQAWRNGLPTSCGWILRIFCTKHGDCILLFRRGGRIAHFFWRPIWTIWRTKKIST